VVPTLTSGRTESRPALDEPFETTDETTEAGVSVRWGVTPNVALNATVNPDFSQVEADVAQLNVNERFALFFPERRPFFLEGADLFTTPLDIVFTRTVADPKYGLKLTGKEGRHAFGVFAAQDSFNNLILPGPEFSSFTSRREDVQSGVVRYRRDVGSTSTLGVLYTGREAEGYHNHVLGLDGTVRLSDSDTVRFQALGSDTEYPEELALERGQPTGSFDDLAWRVDYTRVTREWFWLARGTVVGEDFRADSGFLPQVGYREAVGAVERTFWGEPDGWFSRLMVQLDATHRETEHGVLLEDGVNLTVTYEGPLQSNVRVAIRPNKEGFLGQEFEDLRGDVRVRLRPSGNFGMELFVRGGETIDFVNVRQTDFLLVQPHVDFQLGRHVSGVLEHAWERFEVPAGRFLQANLSQATVVYHLNVRTFFRAILQYQDIERDLALYNPGIDLEPEEQNLFTQLLFSYKINPETVLFLGYSDVYEGTRSVDLTQRDRSLFLKIGYALVW